MDATPERLKSTLEDRYRVEPEFINRTNELVEIAALPTPTPHGTP